MIRRRRNNFSKETKREAFKRSGGICECHRVRQLPTYGRGCGVKLGDANTFYEHIDPDAMQGRNDLDNCAALTRTCWRLKTATFDLPAIAKDKRRSDRARGIRKLVLRPMPFGREDRLKSKIGGGYEWRDNGEPFKGFRR